MIDASNSRIIGRALFVDGATRDVNEVADGRQWVIGYEWERVYGQWLPPAHNPVVVDPKVGQHDPDSRSGRGRDSSRARPVTAPAHPTVRRREGLQRTER
jgi:hypothetical protein